MRKHDVIKPVSLPKIIAPVTVSKVPEILKVMHTPVKTKVKHINTVMNKNIPTQVETAPVKVPTETKKVQNDNILSRKIDNATAIVKTVSVSKVAVPMAVSKVPEVTNVTAMPVKSKLKTVNVVKSMKESHTPKKTETKSNLPKKEVVKVMRTVQKAVSISVPSVPSVPSIKKVEDIKLLDTAKQHVNTANTEVINVLSKCVTLLL